jgi:hypothetical protein
MKPTHMTPGEVLAAALDAEIPEHRLAKVLSDALVATVTTRSGTTEPDTRSRLAAATLILAYKIGRPVERQEILTVNVSPDETEAALAARIAGSPALRERLRSLLPE